MKVKVYEIEWVNGDKYLDDYGHTWQVNHQELRRINEKGRVEYITDGRYALGLLLKMGFEKIKE